MYVEWQRSPENHLSYHILLHILFNTIDIDHWPLLTYVFTIVAYGGGRQYVSGIATRTKTCNQISGGRRIRIRSGLVSHSGMTPTINICNGIACRNSLFIYYIAIFILL